MLKFIISWLETSIPLIKDTDKSVFSLFLIFFDGEGNGESSCDFGIGLVLIGENGKLGMGFFSPLIWHFFADFRFFIKFLSNDNFRRFPPRLFNHVGLIIGLLGIFKLLLFHYTRYFLCLFLYVWPNHFFLLFIFP